MGDSLSHLDDLVTMIIMHNIKNMELVYLCHLTNLSRYVGNVVYR